MRSSPAVRLRVSKLPEDESESGAELERGELENERELFEDAPGREEELGDRLSAIG